MSVEQLRALAAAVLAQRAALAEPAPPPEPGETVVAAARRYVEAVDRLSRAAPESPAQRRCQTIRLGALHQLRSAVGDLAAAGTIKKPEPEEEDGTHVAHA